MISSNCEFESFKFPCGERQFRILKLPLHNEVAVTFEWTPQEGNAELFDLLLFCDAVKRAGGIINTLTIPYVPYARQDRVAVEGESLAIKVVADLINSINAKCVTIFDPHSDVTSALINNVEVAPQHEFFKRYFLGVRDFYLIAPDSGSQKKIYKLAKETNPLDVIDCSKIRNVKTGEIIKTVVHAEDLQGKLCVIVDDICDGGKSFLKIAEELKKKNAGKIVLMVTHGFFTKGLDVFRGYIDEIYTRKGIIVSFMSGKNENDQTTIESETK